MRPIHFSCQQIFVQRPTDLAVRILDVDEWSDFAGFGPIPGIRKASFERRTEAVVGSRIRVENRDGSTHLEEIVHFDPERRIALELREFSPPLSRLAVAFDEEWRLERRGSETLLERSMTLRARSAFTWPILYGVSRFLEAAIARHLVLMRDSSRHHQGESGVASPSST